MAASALGRLVVVQCHDRARESVCYQEGTLVEVGRFCLVVRGGCVSVYVYSVSVGLCICSSGWLSAQLS